MTESNDTYYVRVSESLHNETDASAVYLHDLSAGIETLDEYDLDENSAMATPIELDRTIEAVVTGPKRDFDRIPL